MVLEVEIRIATSDQVAQSEKVLGAAQRKYQAGYSDFLTITDAERSVYVARDQLSDMRRARLVASVALFKALGGGWTEAKDDVAEASGRQ